MIQRINRAARSSYDMFLGIATSWWFSTDCPAGQRSVSKICEVRGHTISLPSGNRWCIHDRVRQIRQRSGLQFDPRNVASVVRTFQNKQSARIDHDMCSHDGVAPPHSAANWLADGPWLSTRQGYLQTAYQGMVATLEYFARQIPSSVKFEIDHDILRRAFSLADENGQRIVPREWKLHPSGDVPQMTRRRQAAKEWEEHKAKMSKFIPHMVVTEASTEPSSKARTNKPKRMSPLLSAHELLFSIFAGKHKRDTHQDSDSDETTDLTRPRGQSYSFSFRRSIPTPFSSRPTEASHERLP